MINKYCGSAFCGKLVNIEMDMNQVLPNHDVVIYGVQCDGWSGTWDYAVNEGTPTRSLITWRHSNVRCDPAKWTKDSWHHIQIAYSRDTSGTVTYESVSLDGVESDFSGAVGPSRFALNWAPVLLTNFQMDGQGAKGTQTMETANTTGQSPEPRHFHRRAGSRTPGKFRPIDDCGGLARKTSCSCDYPHRSRIATHSQIGLVF